MPMNLECARKGREKKEEKIKEKKGIKKPKDLQLDYLPAICCWTLFHCHCTPELSQAFACFVL